MNRAVHTQRHRGERKVSRKESLSVEKTEDANRSGLLRHDSHRFTSSGSAIIELPSGSGASVEACKESGGRIDTGKENQDRALSF